MMLQGSHGMNPLVPGFFSVSFDDCVGATAKVLVQ
jgi:hypothetical protein